MNVHENAQCRGIGQGFLQLTFAVAATYKPAYKSWILAVQTKPTNRPHHIRLSLVPGRFRNFSNAHHW
jgi:hypothetical protein